MQNPSEQAGATAATAAKKEAAAAASTTLFKNLSDFFISQFVTSNVEQIKAGYADLGTNLDKKLDNSSGKITDKINTLLRAILEFVAELATTVPSLINGLFTFLTANLGKLFQYLTGTALDPEAPTSAPAP